MKTPFVKLRAGHLRLGRRGETIVCRLLRSKRIDVLVRNYRCANGEIDIVARDGSVLCFVEVKTRRTGSRSRPAAGLSKRQKKRIRRAALTYMREIGRPRVPYRFDLVEVVLPRFGIRELRHWRGHFDERPS